MKKIFAILMTVAMLLSLGTVLASAELPEGISFTPGKYGVEDASDFTPAGDFAITWDADAASKLDLTDGDMSDWADAGYNMVTIDAANMVSWQGDPTTAPAGWSISTYFVADSDWFYIGFYVTDPVFAYGQAGQYNGDAFQVCIDFGGLLGDQLKTDPGELTNPKNIFYSFSCYEDGAPIQIMRQESDQDGWLSEENGDGVKGSHSKTENGWCAEFALSWQQLYDDYVWKAWLDDPRIYVGGVDRLPLKIGCCLYYLDRNETAGAINWAAGSTNGITDDNGTPCVSWTAWDNGLNLALTYENGMSFTCEGIVAMDFEETYPETTEAPETTAPAEPDTTAEPETKAPEVTTVEDMTTGAAGDGSATTTAPTEDKGCGGIVGFGAAAILAAAAAAVVLKKKD